MVKPIRTIRFAVLVVLWGLLSAWCGRTVSADSCLGYPRCGGCALCVVNVREFGHNQTVWRRWPGDPRPAEVFPRSINAEVLPTPEPQRQKALPRTRLHAPGEEVFDTGLPETLPNLPGNFPGEGGLLPQEPTFDFGPGAPEMPAESGGGSLLDPLLPDTTPGVPGVPGLPGGMETPNVLPGMPQNPGSPMPFEPPIEQPFSNLPGAGASLPTLTPPSTSTTATPPQKPFSAVTEQTIAARSIAAQALRARATALPEVVLPAETSVLQQSVQQTVQQTPEADAPPAELEMPDTAVAEATDIATDIAADIAADASPQNAMPRSEAVDPQLPEPAELRQPEPKNLQANWMAALNPGFRGETDRIVSAYSPVGSAVAVEPDEVPTKKEAGASSNNEQPVSYEQRVAKEAIDLPLALGGYCPVELLRNERWVQSDPRYVASHQGRRYLFAGEAQRKQFVDDPDRFVPVHSGNDPVLLVDDERRVPGKMDYCVTYEGRLYMFSMADTLARFQETPKRYVAASND